jgi:hypothetical protein
MWLSSTFYGHHTDLVNRYICVTYVHEYVMSSFPLVVKKPINIADYPSAPMSPHAAPLKQLISLVCKTLSPLKDGLKNRFNFIS